MTVKRAVKFGPDILPMQRWFAITVGLILVTALVQLMFPSSFEWLRWQGDWLVQAPWRAITGHLAHLSVVHAAMNLLAWLLVWQLFKPDWKAGDSWLMLLSLPLVSVLMLWGDLTWYVGLSGVLHGWFLLGAIRSFSSQPALALAMVAALLLKLWWEPNNPMVAAEAGLIGGPVAYVSHQLGVLAMVILLLLQFAYRELSGRVRR